MAFILLVKAGDQGFIVPDLNVPSFADV